MPPDRRAEVNRLADVCAKIILGQQVSPADIMFANQFGNQLPQILHSQRHRREAEVQANTGRLNAAKQAFQQASNAHAQARQALGQLGQGQALDALLGRRGALIRGVTEAEVLLRSRKMAFDAANVKLRELQEYLDLLERSRREVPESEVVEAPIASNIPVSRRKAKPVAEIEYAFACRNSRLLIGADVIVGGMIGKVEQCSGFYCAAMPKVGLMLTKDVGLYVAAGIRRGKKTSPIVGAGIRCDISPKMYAKLEFNRWWTSRVRANVIKVGFGFRF